MSKAEKFKIFLNAIENQIENCLIEYYDAVNENMPEFPIVDYNVFIMHLDETCWDLLDKIVKDDKELLKIRYDWMMEIGKNIIGDDFLDIANLSEEDESYLKKTYTYFEEMNMTGDEDYVRYKSNYTDEDNNPIFDKETGELIDSDRYEFMGEGVVMDNETGEEIEA